MSEDQSFVVHGGLSVLGDWAAENDPTLGVPCFAYGGYDDVRPGLQVVVADETGTTLAVGALEGGEVEGVLGSSLRQRRCRFPFFVNVDQPAKFYRLTIGTRGEHVLTPKEARERIELTLGEPRD